MSLTETETKPAIVRITGSTFSLRVIAAAIILLFCYYAAGVVITLLLSILVAYFLDPAVELLERARVPRTLGAMVMVLILIAVLGAVAYGLGTRTADFAANWSKYSSVLKQAADAVEGKISGIEGRVSEIAPTPGTPVGNDVRAFDAGAIHTLVLRGMGSLYALFLEITFVPFLVFFMLAGKREVWHGTLQLVGRRVRLNAVAITISLLFWGWVWGGMGLLLAIPITATLRVICDHTESWRPIGRWLSA